jgi:glutamine amidotransferase
VIALIDYGAGNLTSVRKAFAALGADVQTVTDIADLWSAEGIVVPGVGHFDATAAIAADWRSAIRTRIDDGLPVLGICLGLQWFFAGSAESTLPGLAVFDGHCQRLDAPKVPHVGWNSLEPRFASRLMTGVPAGAQVYFTHSYAAPVTDVTVASTTYVTPFAAAVERGNVFAVQFHPEKSGDVGLRILGNWLNAL